MTLPVERILPVEQEDLHKDLTLMYSDLAGEINGKQSEWTPTISGAGTAGVGTYTTHSGIYYRQGLLTDIWFYIVLSAHTGAGDMMIDLPYKSAFTAEDVFVDAIEIGGINLSANYYYAMARVGTNSFQAAMIEVGDTAADTPQAIAIDAVCSVRGHIRYIGQENT